MFTATRGRWPGVPAKDDWASPRPFRDLLSGHSLSTYKNPGSEDGIGSGKHTGKDSKWQRSSQTELVIRAKTVRAGPCVTPVAPGEFEVRGFQAPNCLNQRKSK